MKDNSHEHSCEANLSREFRTMLPVTKLPESTERKHVVAPHSLMEEYFQGGSDLLLHLRRICLIDSSCTVFHWDWLRVSRFLLQEACFHLLVALLLFGIQWNWNSITNKFCMSEVSDTGTLIFRSVFSIILTMFDKMKPRKNLSYSDAVWAAVTCKWFLKACTESISMIDFYYQI